MANWPSNNITNLQTIIQLIIIMRNRAIILILLSILSLTMMLSRELSTVQLSICTQVSIFGTFLSWWSFEITSLGTLWR